MSYLFGIPDAVFITGPDGGFSLSLGVPITGFGDPQAAASALFADGDAFPAPAVARGAVTLAPSLLGSDDAIYAPAAVPGSVTLAPAAYTDADAVYAPTVAASGATLSLLPGLVADQDSFLRPLADLVSPPRNTLHFRPGVAADGEIIYPAAIGFRLAPSFVADETIYAAGAARVLQPATVPSDDAVPSFGTTRFLQPSLVAGDDAIPAADVGWQIITGVAFDADAIYGAHVDAYFEIQAAILIEDDVIDSYPYFIHNVSGGIPTPEKEHLSGSIRPPLRVLKGSIGRKVYLTGSIKDPRRRVLTGSTKSISYNNKPKR